MRKTQTPVIEIEKATVEREGETFLREISLTVSRGEDIAVIGPNGAGKTSLMKLITREYYPLLTGGISPIRIYGQTKWDLFEIRKKMGVVTADLQATCSKDLTGKDIVLSGFFGSIGTYPHQKITKEMRKKASETIAFLGIGHLKDKYLSNMSTGEARRFLIGRALVNDPQMLILDEPTNSLDLKAAYEFLTSMRKIAQSGKNIFLITHHISEIIPEIKRVVMIKEGEIFLDGKKEEVLTSRNVSDLFETEVALHKTGGYYGITYK